MPLCKVTLLSSLGCVFYGIFNPYVYYFQFVALQEHIYNVANKVYLFCPECGIYGSLGGKEYVLC